MEQPEQSAKQSLNDQLTRVAKAIAHPKRIELLDLLAQCERPVDALAGATDLAVTTTSSHLQVLLRAHLVATRKQGTRVYYRLAGDDVAALLASLREVASLHLPEVDRVERDHLIDGAEPISRAELLDRVRRGDLVLIDVRPAEEYAAGHIRGAVSMPLDAIEARLGELPAEAEIVAYCRGPWCVLAPEAVRLLHRKGRHARRLADGVSEWRRAGLAVDALATPEPTSRKRRSVGT